MLLVFIRAIVLTSLVVVTGCSSMPMNSWLVDDTNQATNVDQDALMTIQQLIEQQPGKNSLTLAFDGHSTSLKSDHIRAISQWIIRPVSSVEIKVGPVRHQDVVSAINISRQRGQRITRVLNTFKLPARVSYDPSLAVNTIEVTGWQ